MLVCMTERVRAFLRRRMPPERYERVKYVWWTWRARVPRGVASLAVRRSPAVQEFPQGQPSQLADELRAVNVVKLTDFCLTMLVKGSDKSWGMHNYTRVYAALFGGWRDRPLRLFEIGLGSSDTSMPFSMGIDGRPGASLRGWRALFPKAAIFGADIDRKSLFEEERIQTFYCDQLDPAAIRDLWSEPALAEGMDILIDDGYHSFDANTCFLRESLGQLRAGGFYIVEDIHRDALAQWRGLLSKGFLSNYPGHEFAMVELPNPLNHRDNNLLVIHKRADA